MTPKILTKILTKTAAAVALACAAAIPVAQAHNVWLLPSATVLSKSGDWITVDAAVANDLFYFNHFPLGLDNLVITAPDGSQLAPQNAHKGRLRSVFDLELKQAGTYRLAVVNAGITASYKDAEGKAKRFRGTAEKFAAEVPANAQELKVTESISRVETFVTQGKPSAITPSGKGLELVPITHPNDLAKGEQARFAFHMDGKPAPDLEVALVRGATRYRDDLQTITVKTDAKGEFAVTWPEAGMYWVDADAQDAKTTEPKASVRRLAYVGTLEVLP